MLLLVILCLASWNIFGETMKPKAFINATIFSGSQFLNDVDSFLVSDGRFKYFGDSKSITSMAPDKEDIINLNGALVMPGFIESHAHLLGLGKSKLILDLSGLDKKAIANLVERQTKTLPKDNWIIGRGWDQNLWPDNKFPDKDILSAVLNPVYLIRVDGHAIWVNDTALKVANINQNTQDPKGGQIIRDAAGKPTGVFIDAAIDLIAKYLGKPDRKTLLQHLDLGMKEANRHGITSFHDAGVGADTLQVFQEQAKERKLTVRIYAMIDGEDEKTVEKFLAQGPVFINDMLTIRSIKYFADGALGSRGAYLLSDYHDQPGHRGLMLIEKDSLLKKTTNALNAGFQVATHAIGDGANRMVLDVYEQALKTSRKSNTRLRVEHAQFIDPKDHHRFKELGVIASMQPIHCTSDMPWVEKRIAKNILAKRAYPWRSLLKQGTLLAFGSDAPVENINPILGIYAAVSRKDIKGNPAAGFMPEEKLTLQEALNGYYSNAAHAEFNEHQKGLIKQNYFADFIVFEKNILKKPSKDLFLKAEPSMTIVGGEIVFKK